MCLQSCFSPGVLGSVCSYTEPSCEDPAESKAGLLRLQGALKQTQGFEASEPPRVLHTFAYSHILCSYPTRASASLFTPTQVLPAPRPRLP